MTRAAVMSIGGPVVRTVVVLVVFFVLEGPLLLRLAVAGAYAQHFIGDAYRTMWELQIQRLVRNNSVDIKTVRNRVNRLETAAMEDA